MSSSTTHKGIYLGKGPDGKTQYYTGDRHLFLIGPNGSGKGARLLTQNIALLTDRSMFIVDPKGEACAMTIEHRRKYGDVVVINPFGLMDDLPHLRMQSTGFNPLAALDPDSKNFVDQATALAEATMRGDGSGKDSHWIPSARSLWASLLMWVKVAYPKSASFGLARQLLTEPSTYEIREDGKRGAPLSGLRFTAMQIAACRDDYPAIASKAGRFLEAREEIDGIISTAITQTDFLDSAPIADDMAKGSGFRFADMRRKTVTVYLILPAQYLRTHSGWVRIIIQSALSDLYGSRPDASKPRILFVLDELPAAIGNLAAVEDAMGLARGYRIQLWPVVQDLSQLKDLYDKRWETFIGNTGALISFSPSDWTTAEYLSKLTGTKLEVRPSRSVSDATTNTGTTHTESTSENLASVPVLRPDELMSMGAQNPDHALVRSHQFVGSMITTVLPYWKMDALKPHLAPNPYHGS